MAAMTVRPETVVEMPLREPVGDAPFRNLRNGKNIVTLALGVLPAKMARVTRYCREYRRALQTAVMDVCKEVDTTAAHYVDEACAWEQHRQVCRWLLRTRLPEMKVADVRECSKAMAYAVSQRNQAVRHLGLDSKAGDNVLDVLYSPPDDSAKDNGDGSAEESRG
jgi:hypothetical protein